MGMLDPNTLIGIVNGKIGDLVFVRTKDGRVIVRHRPVRESAPTGPELGNQNRFASAAAYVKKVRQQPDQYAAYELAAKLKDKRACDLAHADSRHNPEITDVDLSGYTGQPGEVVLVQAIDDFEVVSVWLTFAQLDGTLVEHGAATLAPHSAQWRYAAQTPVPPGQTLTIHVTAIDRAGNTVAKTFHRALESSVTLPGTD